jgi:hypothetical protein
VFIALNLNGDLLPFLSLDEKFQTDSVPNISSVQQVRSCHWWKVPWVSYAFPTLDVPSSLLDHNGNRCRADTPRSGRFYHRLHRSVRLPSLPFFFPLMVVDVVLTHKRVTDAKPRRPNGLIARQLYRVGWKWQYTRPSSRLGHRRRAIVTPAAASSSRYTRNQTDWDPMATQNAGCRGGSECADCKN